MNGIINISNKYNGTFSVIADIEGCLSQKEKTTAIINKLPSNFLPSDTSTCGSVDFTINLSGTYKNYQWQDGSGLSFHNVTEPGKYWVKVTDENNCKGTDTIFISILCPPILWVPTAFTPNNDNINDKLKFIGENITAFNVKIFDRWGSIVYESNEIKAPWDGTMKGKTLPLGVYTAYIHYEGYQNDRPVKINKRSYITILK